MPTSAVRFDQVFLGFPPQICYKVTCKNHNCQSVNVSLSVSLNLCLNMTLKVGLSVTLRPTFGLGNQNTQLETVLLDLLACNEFETLPLKKLLEYLVNIVLVASK